MSYKVNYTETQTNPSKPAIVVEDQTQNDYDTSLSFPGKNYPSYGKIIAENFLHLLENFASNNAPAHPIEGQLWYDNSADVNLLKVYDGTQWTAAGSVKKSNSAPSVGIIGDLWVNTNTQQLHVYSGSNWLLIGPQYSEGAKTGPDVETIVDTNNTSHTVFSFYANNNRLAILSKEAFTPKLSTPGFSTIGQGLNITSVDETSTTAPTKVWGIAERADALVVNGSKVAATNFLRSDVASISNSTLGVRADGGITVGNDLGFTMYIDGNSSVIWSKTVGSSIDFRLNNSGTVITPLHLDSSGKVGINNNAPLVALDVVGDVVAAGDLTTTGKISGDSLEISNTSIFRSDVTTYGQQLVNYFDLEGNPTTFPAILPGTDEADGLYDIGSEARRFRNIYAQEFVGSFSGAFTGSLAGSVTGSAGKLFSPTAFSMQGDVSSDIVDFDGQTPQPGHSPGEIVFTTTINSNLISAKDSVTDSFGSDYLLIYRAGVAGGLKKTSKQTFISNIPVVPVGALFPFAGSTAPAGYLLCDGGEVKISDYPQLFAVIGYTYKQSGLLGSNTFALPDMRGRFPLGRDNMDNGTLIPDKDDPSILRDAGGGSANRVTPTTADSIGEGAGSESISISVNNLPEHRHTLQSTSGKQYFAAGTPTGGAGGGDVAGYGMSTITAPGYGLPNSGGVEAYPLGNAINTMNPYMTVNYIIFTGVI